MNLAALVLFTGTVHMCCSESCSTTHKRKKEEVRSTHHSEQAPKKAAHEDLAKVRSPTPAGSGEGPGSRFKNQSRRPIQHDLESSTLDSVFGLRFSRFPFSRSVFGHSSGFGFRSSRGVAGLHRITCGGHRGITFSDWFVLRSSSLFLFGATGQIFWSICSRALEQM